VLPRHHEVFRRYLTEGKPGFVPHRWARLGDAVRWITGAGGVAVIAHPARYRFTPNEEYALFTEFKAHGGQGSRWSPAATAPPSASSTPTPRCEFGLAASRGSDFHSPDESHTDLGTLPDAAGRLTPVWERCWRTASSEAPA
jgi:predicted metal-dependent phosphoesterase TrpH